VGQDNRIYYLAENRIHIVRRIAWPPTNDEAAETKRPLYPSYEDTVYVREDGYYPQRGAYRVNVRAGGGTERTYNGRRESAEPQPPLDPPDDAILELAAQKAAHNMNDRYPDPGTDLTPDQLIIAVVQEHTKGISGRYYAVARRVNARALELAHTAGWAAKVKEKVCTECNELLPADYFGPHKNDRTGLQPYCRTCSSARRKRLRHEAKRNN
jgi:hypothetical protein